MFAVIVFHKGQCVDTIIVSREEARTTARFLRTEYPHREGYRVEVTRYDA